MRARSALRLPGLQAVDGLLAPLTACVGLRSHGSSERSRCSRRIRAAATRHSSVSAIRCASCRSVAAAWRPFLNASVRPAAVSAQAAADVRRRSGASSPRRRARRRPRVVRSSLRLRLGVEGGARVAGDDLVVTNAARGRRRGRHRRAGRRTGAGLCRAGGRVRSRITTLPSLRVARSRCRHCTWSLPRDGTRSDPRLPARRPVRCRARPDRGDPVVGTEVRRNGPIVRRSHRCAAASVPAVPAGRWLTAQGSRGDRVRRSPVRRPPAACTQSRRGPRGLRCRTAGQRGPARLGELWRGGGRSDEERCSHFTTTPSTETAARSTKRAWARPSKRQATQPCAAIGPAPLRRSLPHVLGHLMHRFQLQCPEELGMMMGEVSLNRCRTAPTRSHLRAPPRTAECDPTVTVLDRVVCPWSSSAQLHLVRPPSASVGAPVSTSRADPRGRCRYVSRSLPWQVAPPEKPIQLCGRGCPSRSTASRWRVDLRKRQVRSLARVPAAEPRPGTSGASRSARCGVGARQFRRTLRCAHCSHGCARALRQDALVGRDELMLELPAPVWITTSRRRRSRSNARAGLERRNPRQRLGAGQIAVQHRQPRAAAGAGRLAGAAPRVQLGHSLAGAGGDRRAGLRLGGTPAWLGRRVARSLIDAEALAVSYGLLMDAYAAAGNVAEGLRVFERLRTLLREELGTSPSPDAIAAHERLLRRGRRPARRRRLTSAGLGSGSRPSWSTEVRC